MSTDRKPTKNKITDPTFHLRMGNQAILCAQEIRFRISKCENTGNMTEVDDPRNKTTSVADNVNTLETLIAYHEN